MSNATKLSACNNLKHITSGLLFLLLLLLLLHSYSEDTIYTHDLDVSNVHDTPLCQPKGMKLLMLINMGFCGIVGFCGNLYTLIALPYVRMKYKKEFTSLQTSAALLLFHLSLCDILYILVQFPHLIQVYVLGYLPYENNGSLCYILGLLSYILAFADFTTISAISLFLCLFKHCKTCHSTGNITSHRDHDKVFGGRRILLVILLIWIFAIGLMVPDLYNNEVTFGWTCIYGCDRVPLYNDTMSGRLPQWNMYIGVFFNLAVIIVSYSLVVRKLAKDRLDVNKTDLTDVAARVSKLTRRDIITMLSLTLAYILFVIPSSIWSWSGGLSEEDDVLYAKGLFSMWYWWMYGINFLIYIFTNESLRAAYSRFNRDIINCIQRQTTLRALPEGSDEKTTAIWWIELQIQDAKDAICTCESISADGTNSQSIVTHL